jgi:uncharacterized protein (TIGR01244 family)
VRCYLSAFFLAAMALPASADLKAPGIPNFHQVNQHIYRGGQPTEEGWKSLASLGVKTVIDLRRDGEDDHSIAAESKAVQSAGMKYVSVPMKGIVAPRDEDIIRVLRLFNSGEPVFVHCKKGKDRTGTVIACYRIAHNQWENDKAMEEAKSHGLHWYEVGMKRYIQEFRASDVLVSSAQDLKVQPARP